MGVKGELCKISKWIRRDVWNYFVESMKIAFGTNYGITNKHLERALYHYSKQLRKDELREIGIRKSVVRGRGYKFDYEDMDMYGREKIKKATIFGGENDGRNDNDK